MCSSSSRRPVWSLWRILRCANALIGNNPLWAGKAAVLFAVASKDTVLIREGVEVANRTSAFDTGAAWGHLALQAHLSGWHTHGMAGFDQELTRKELKIPQGYALHAAVAVGKLGDKSSLPEYLQGREMPSPRKPLSELVSQGDFSL